MSRLNIGALALKNPVMPASGTYGRELVPFVSPKRLGAIVTRSITLQPCAGSPPPRMVETASGLLSDTGCENQGIESFLRDELPYWSRFTSPLILNVAGGSEEEFVQIASIVAGARGVSAVELNLSALDGTAFVPGRTSHLVSAVREKLALPLIAKLSSRPEILEMAKLSEGGGADAISLVNGFPATSLDRRSSVRLGGKQGRLSGPAIKPLALRLVEEVSAAVSIPVIGMGGIFTAKDAREFMIAGASAVAVGTASFVNPRALLDVADGLESLQ